MTTNRIQTMVQRSEGPIRCCRVVNRESPYTSISRNGNVDGPRIQETTAVFHSEGQCITTHADLTRCNGSFTMIEFEGQESQV
ncbi:unnamed protein product [Orchesella dallaii]|uniref:Uncharacterized protein n=1 Tax=Orchesella dallaii TaxID=48710 RepID=A0ABP1PI95_9HEXA